MKVGTLCYACDSGLGRLAYSFYQHGVVTNPIVVRHGVHHTYKEWYPSAYQISSMKSMSQLREVEELCKQCDIMLFFETPFHWSLIEFCRLHGIKTVLMTMYECTHRHPPAVPDMYLCPSKLDYDVFSTSYPKPTSTRVEYLPVPVETEWRLRTKAKTFIHNAGHGGLKGRNGTAELISALKYVESPIDFILRSQVPIIQLVTGYPEIPDNVKFKYHPGTVSDDQLFNEGDVFVFPEKFNGLSLPLQEARAAGMLVMGSNRYPMNEWLPEESLIKVSETKKSSIGSGYLLFDEAIISPLSIASKIDQWYDKDITDYSTQGKLWAETMSWRVLKSQYLQLLESL